MSQCNELKQNEMKTWMGTGLSNCNDKFKREMNVHIVRGMRSFSLFYHRTKSECIHNSRSINTCESRSDSIWSLIEWTVLFWLPISTLLEKTKVSTCDWYDDCVSVWLVVDRFTLKVMQTDTTFNYSSIFINTKSYICSNFFCFNYES